MTIVENVENVDVGSVSVQDGDYEQVNLDAEQEEGLTIRSDLLRVDEAQVEIADTQGNAFTAKVEGIINNNEIVVKILKLDGTGDEISSGDLPTDPGEVIRYTAYKL